MESLREKLDHAWTLKRNLRWEECLAAVAQLKQACQIPSGNLSREAVLSLVGRAEPGPISEVLLLQSALCRVLGDASTADALTTNIEQALIGCGVLSTFALAYEKGMVQFQRGDFSVALEEFLRAASLTKEPINRLIGLGNAVLCMENLALPYEHTLAQVKALLAGIPERPELQKVRDQLHAFELRELFRQGHVQECVRKESARKQTQVDQAKYFEIWVRHLPFHHTWGTGKSEIESFLRGSVYLQYKAYRIRTLQGLLHPEDTEVAKPSEFVDRLYLWTWRWLENPDSFPVDKVLTLVREFLPQGILHRLTCEDCQMLRNALMWLGLFDPTAERHVVRIVQRLSNPSSEDYPIWRLESLLLHYLQAVRDNREIVAEDYWRALEAHPLWNSKQLKFRALAQAIRHEKEAPKPLARLVALVRGALDQGRDSSALFIVDINQQRITDKKAGKQIVSEAMCIAFNVLNQHGSMPCEEFVQLCFGLRVFDPFIHNGKIFNLLSRMKGIARNKPVFRVKNGRVLADGDWSDFHFITPQPVAGLLGALPQWERSFITNPNKDADRRTSPSTHNKGSIFQPALWKDGLTRSDLERVLSRPRSTVNRLLKNWVTQGQVVRTGEARSSRYFLQISKSHSDVAREGIS